MSTATLPKYVQNANRIIEVIAAQENQTWDRTQRELGEALDFSQPQLSNLLKMLIDTGKIRKGGRIVGTRGGTCVLELVDAEPLEGRVRREKKMSDRPLEPQEEISNGLDLGTMTLDHIGAAVVRLMKRYWEQEERFNQMRGDYLQRNRELREQLQDERRLRIRLATDKENLERQTQDQEQDITKMRGEINRLIIHAQEKRRGDGAGTFQVRDMLDEEEMRILESLMKEKPGFSRQSDREVGLQAS